MGKKMAGRAGAEKIVKVPVGTVVWSADESKHGTSNLQSSTPKSDQSVIEPLVDLVRDRQEFVLCRGGAGAKGTFISKARATAHRGNTPRGRKVSKDISCSSCGRSPTQGWLATPMQANRHSCEKSLPRGQRWRHIHSRRCIRSSA